MKHYSPLRYPGGKSRLAPFVAKLCVTNGVNNHYIEPYSGGASVALFLLMNGFVNQITINDKDRSIYAFWHSVINHTDKFCERICSAEMSVQEWKKQREIQKQKDTIDLFELGFSTFYLNRTNRSGIITGGLMGGINQTGKYLMHCRFNREGLIERIENISTFRNKINLHNRDAVELIDELENQIDENAIFYFDPPYYYKASSLYLNHYKESDHKKVSNRIKEIRNSKWIVSYDNVAEIKYLYSEFRSKEFSFKHTAYEARLGKEIMFFSNNLSIPKGKDWNPLKFKFRTAQQDLVYTDR